jgi:hypothetical protein
METKGIMMTFQKMREININYMSSIWAGPNKNSKPQAQKNFWNWQHGAYEHIFLLSYYYCAGATLGYLQNFLQYIIVEFTSPSLSFSSPPFLEYFQQVSFFHLYTWTYIATKFSLVHPFLISPPTQVPTSPNRNYFVFLFSVFERKAFLFI